MIRGSRKHGGSGKPAESRVTRRKRETRTRIFRAALRLFTTRGLDDTTVADIAHAADIGKGTFFTYFPTKESIFADVSLELVEAMERRLDGARTAGASPESRLRAFFTPALDWHAANPLLSRYMLAAFLRDEAYARADRAAQQRLYEQLAREVASALDASLITPDVESGAAITAVAGTYFGTLAAWHGAGTRTRLAADFASSLQIVFRGLRP